MTFALDTETTIPNNRRVLIINYVPLIGNILVGNDNDEILVYDSTRTFLTALNFLGGVPLFFAASHTSDSFLTSKDVALNLNIFNADFYTFDEEYSGEANLVGTLSAGAFNTFDDFFVTGGSDNKLYIFTGSIPPNGCDYTT